MSDVMRSIRRTPYQSLASFLILLFTLFLTLFFFNLTSFFNGILTYVETKPQVTAYFQTNVKEEDVMKVKQEIESSGKTLSVKYISKQQALKIYQDLNKSNPLLLEMVSADILPPSLEIYAKKPAYLLELSEYLKKQPGIDEVVFQRAVVDRLLALTTTLRKVSLLILIFLLVISFIVLMTTTAFKIALKKEEIELLQLLGASKYYIQKPFLLEGAFFGWSSGTLAFLIFYAIFFYFYPFLKSYMGDITNLSLFGLSQYNIYVWPPNLPFFVVAYAMTVTFGVVIGVIGNFLSTSKYIR